MLVVWEPILPTDWESPSRTTLDRISDPRVRQFWDPDHEISKAVGRIARRLPSGPAPNSSGGFFWDQALVFAPHVKWENDPDTSFWAGPVFEVIPHLAEALSRLTRYSEIGTGRGRENGKSAEKQTSPHGFGKGSPCISEKFPRIQLASATVVLQ